MQMNIYSKFPVAYWWTLLWKVLFFFFLNNLGDFLPYYDRAEARNRKWVEKTDGKVLGNEKYCTQLQEQYGCQKVSFLRIQEQVPTLPAASTATSSISSEQQEALYVARVTPDSSLVSFRVPLPCCISIFLMPEPLPSDKRADSFQVDREQSPKHSAFTSVTSHDGGEVSLTLRGGNKKKSLSPLTMGFSSLIGWWGVN